MKIKILLLLLIAVLNVPNHANSTEKKYSPKFDKCMDTTISGSPMRKCIEDEQKLLDKKLNRTYANLLKLEKPERKIQLDTAQKLWIRYRNANCDFYVDPDGGTMRLEMSDFCYLEFTYDRVKELEEFIYLRKESNP